VDWDVSKVTIMSAMFYKAKKFNQDLTGWQVGQITKTSDCQCAVCPRNAARAANEVCQDHQDHPGPDV
jgi:hypothetical protein